MAKANRASINGARTVDRVVQRLGRVQDAITQLERRESGFFDFDAKKRIRAKIERLQDEEAELERELSGIRSAIDRAV